MINLQTHTTRVYSNQTAHFATSRRLLCFVLGLHHALSWNFGPDDHPHRLLEDFLEPLLGESAALKVPALELVLDDLLGSFLLDGCILGVFVFGSSLIP